MSATAFQRKRRELLEQTSVNARMNEEGPGDPYAKTDANYDQVGVKDTGEEHQAGNPPPFSLTGHVPEQLPEGQPGDPDPGTVHQAGEPPLTSVELREGEEPGEGEPFEDQARYDALGVREAATAGASFVNVDLAEPGEVAGDDLDDKTVAELRDLAAERDISGRSGMNRSELLAALRG